VVAYRRGTTLSTPELLGRLVAFDSTSENSNLPIADFICEYLDRPGFHIARNPSLDGSKANVIITAGAPGEGRKGLVLSGHMDVVPARENGWVSDPFTLTDRDDTYVARGAADMKAFLTLAMNQAARQSPSKLAAPLVLVFTFDEELGTLGARHLVETWPASTLPVRAIIGEPTSLRARERARIAGIPTWAGTP